MVERVSDNIDIILKKERSWRRPFHPICRMPIALLLIRMI